MKIIKRPDDYYITCYNCNKEIEVDEVYIRTGLYHGDYCTMSCLLSDFEEKKFFEYVLIQADDEEEDDVE